MNEKLEFTQLQPGRGAAEAACGAASGNTAIEPSELIIALPDQLSQFTLTTN